MWHLTASPGFHFPLQEMFLRYQTWLLLSFRSLYMLFPCQNSLQPECFQTADKMHRPWKQTVTEFLPNYRATQHATTGVTPFELLRHRKMRTNLHVHPVSHNIKRHTHTGGRDIKTKTTKRTKSTQRERSVQKYLCSKQMTRCVSRDPICHQERRTKHLPAQWWSEMECIQAGVLP